MPRINRKESPTGIYHVMQRGVGKQVIFEEDSDYKFYLKKLVEYKNLLDVEVLAYCLMDNHVHLLVSAESMNNMSRLIQRLGSSYAVYYNQKYLHTGHVFQGRFACEIVDSDQYLLTCTRYIHNNPVKAGITTRESYKWSSYNDYVLGKGIAKPNKVMTMLGSINHFIEFSQITDDADVMDCDRMKLTTKDGIELVRKKCGYDIEDGTVVGRLCKNDRDSILRELKNTGFTIKQIQRITGVSKTIIYRA